MNTPSFEQRSPSLLPPMASSSKDAAQHVSIVSNDVIYPTIPPWNGRVLACYRRNSTTRQRDNARAFFQFHDLGNYCLSLGFAVRLFDEQATSAASLSKRSQMNNVIAAILAGAIHGIAVVDISRLTRDKHGIDPEYIGQLLVRYAEGRLLFGSANGFWKRSASARVRSLYQNGCKPSQKNLTRRMRGCARRFTRHRQSTSWA